MGNLREFFLDLGRNAYGLGENVASLGSAAIAEPVAGYAAMFDPANGAQAIREGMTYTPRTEAGRMYQQGAAKTLGAMVQPAMPVIDTWQRGVDIAGRYSPVAGAALQTVPTALGVALGAKPALQQGRQLSNSLGALQQRMIANASAPRTLNMGFMRQRGAVDILDTLNPTGNVFVDYNPEKRATAKLASNIVTYDKTAGGRPDDLIEIYRGLPKNKKNINSGDFVTTNKQLAKDYAGDGHVISMRVKKSELLDDVNEPLSEEYIYRTAKHRAVGTQRPLTEFEQAHLTAQRNAALPVSQGGLGLPPNNTAMDRARALGFEDGWAHGSPNPKITEMKPSSTGAEGPGTYATNYLPEASTYSFLNEGSTVYPLMVNRSKTLNANGNVYDLLRANSDDELLMNLEKAGKDSITANQSKTPQWLLDAGAPYMPDRMHYVSVKPYNFRSRFAAFDPMKRDSANLLAQYGAIAPATTFGAYMYNEKQKQKKQGQ